MSRRYRYQSDAALLTDYQELLPRKNQLQPEEKLMAVILEDALWCFRENTLGRTEQERARFQEAEDWILAEGNGWLYSFESICLQLDINYECLRKKLMAWKEIELQDSACVSAEVGPLQRQAGCPHRRRMK